MTRTLALALVAAACGHAPAPVTTSTAPAGARADAATPDADTRAQDEQLAAIQKAMNELAPAVQQCWAVAAAERLAIAGELTAQMDFADGSHATPKVTLVRDTAHSEKLAACASKLLSAYNWAPPLAGASIQLPFAFAAPSGQSVIDRRFVDVHAHGGVSTAVLLDAQNTGNAAASMIELALADDASFGRSPEHDELWFFLTDGHVMWGGPTPKPAGEVAAANDMLFVPAGSRWSVAGTSGTRAVVVSVPGGQLDWARSDGPFGVGVARSNARKPHLYRHADAKTFGPATIYLDATLDKTTPLAASTIAFPAGAVVPLHVHEHETELLYVLEGTGVMTIADSELPISATSVVQVPPNTMHAFRATTAVRALQIYTPAGPEQRFKKVKP